jgi:tRNA 2-thiouridine synthesizing protein A
LTAKLLDLRGLKCPLPALRTRKALLGLAPGTRLIVEATDPMASVDIPHMLAGTGDVLLASETQEGVLRFTILRADDPQARG